MIDWHSIVLEPTWLNRLDKVCLKRFSQTGLADEAAAYVIQELSSNNWEKCQSFTGQAKPETYLYTLTGNLIEEFARKRFGRARPPEWLKREGDLWVSIWKMVCLERQMPQTVADHFETMGHRSKTLVLGVIKTIKGRLPWCGSSNREIPASMICSFGDDDIEPEIESEHTLEQALEADQLEDYLLIVHELLNNIFCPSNQTYSNIKLFTDIESQQIFIKCLALSNEETLLLKMAYQEGIKLNVIAKSLNLPSYQPGRLLKGVLKRIESALTQANFPMDALASQFREGSI